MQPTDGTPLTTPLPGQFVVLRLRAATDAPLLYRSYSLSGPPSDLQYRVSVKVEPHGVAGNLLSRSVRTGDVLDVSEPRGSFTLQAGDSPVVLVSAGIGATPMLAMLHALALTTTPRKVWWLHGARDGKSHSFAVEARQLLAKLGDSRSQVWYSRPTADDQEGRDYDATGHVGMEALEQLGVPRDGDFYVCGPSGFLGDLRTGLAAWGVPAQRIHSELFSGGPSLTPGVIAAPVRAPHLPTDSPGTGPLVSFARSGIAVRWRIADQSLLELAEACDVPVRWSCRTGVCHNCESGLISGTVSYQPDPLDPPANGNVLICCSRPQEDVVIDL
jgi:ferredoxin-NADP reductase